MNFVVVRICRINIMNSWFMRELLSIIKSIWIGSLELESIIPWLLVLPSVLSLFVKSWPFSMWNLNLRVFVNILRLSRVFIAHFMSSLVDVTVHVLPSWLMGEVVGVELIIINKRVLSETSVLIRGLFDGVSVSNEPWSFSDRVFSVLIKSCSLAQTHVSNVLLDVGRLVCS
jgi:hypothetical protein